MVGRLHHVGVVVRSLEEAYRFFRDALGLPLLKEAVIEEQGVRAALLDLGNGLLELLEPTVPDTGIARYLERRGEGLHHLCLETDDIEAELAGLKAKGVPLVDETPREGLTGTIAFLHPSALCGVLVELVHGPTCFRAAASPPRRAEARPGEGQGLVPGSWFLIPGGAGRGGVVSRLDHLVLAVQDLEQAAQAWARTFGLQPEPPYHPPGSHLQLARLPLPDAAQGGAYLELVTDVEAALALSDAEALARLPRSLPRAQSRGRRVARFLAERGEGMFSLSLEVADLDAAVRELRARGVTVSEPEVGVWPGTRLSRIPRARAHGVAVQLIERAADR